MENTLIVNKSDRVLEMVKLNGVYTIKKKSFLKKWWGTYFNRLVNRQSEILMSLMELKL